MTPEEMRREIEHRWEREEQRAFRRLMWRLAARIVIVAALAVVAWVAVTH